VSERREVERPELDDRLAGVDALVREVEELPDERAREKAREVVAAVLDLHAAALARVLEIAARAEAGRALIDAMAKDELVASVLVLHELHPSDLEARVRSALEGLRTGLVLRGARAELEAAGEMAVKVRVVQESQGCGSDAGRLRSMVEEALGRAAPDVPSIVVEVVSETTAFVPLIRGGGVGTSPARRAGETPAPPRGAQRAGETPAPPRGESA
jgi:hypothetical protein